MEKKYNNIGHLLFTEIALSVFMIITVIVYIGTMYILSNKLDHIYRELNTTNSGINQLKNISGGWNINPPEEIPEDYGKEYDRKTVYATEIPKIGDELILQDGVDVESNDSHYFTLYLDQIKYASLLKDDNDKYYIRIRWNHDVYHGDDVIIPSIEEYSNLYIPENPSYFVSFSVMNNNERNKVSIQTLDLYTLIWILNDKVNLGSEHYTNGKYVSPMIRIGIDKYMKLVKIDIRYYVNQ